MVVSLWAVMQTTHTTPSGGEDIPAGRYTQVWQDPCCELRGWVVLVGIDNSSKERSNVV